MKNDIYKKEVANRLKIFMDSLNFNQIQLSRELNVRNTRINNYLNAVSLPDLEFLEILCRKYKQLDLRWFLTGEGKFDSNEPIIAQTNNGYNLGHMIIGKDCPSLLENAEKEIEYLKKQVEDKELIISLLKPNK